VSGDEKSRTQHKREVMALQQLGEELSALSAEKLKSLSLSESLLDAILEVKRYKSHGARRRQFLFIGGLLRNMDTMALEQALADMQKGRAEGSRSFHKLERWRNELIDENDELLATICADYPAADHQRLNQLVRNARKEREREGEKKWSRALFRWLRDLRDETRRL
jgi:ribosome-associated protein